MAARHHKGLTQQVVADKLRKPQSYVAKIEGGERRLDILEFVALAKAMDIDPMTLFADVLRGIKKET
ncbi:helix-turn-helix domain-containing protein [Hoeflea alexandrii]|uniref:helix-turn-helix domain-containing protein n=1 Tax=Hoeflea alexandrii TaxID=288436 RepID=UPI0022AF097B|nr:helix-turn-helix transcriptional regulator [Hoeflea alexandrii]